MDRRRVVFIIKLLVSVGIVAYIYREVLGREGGDDLGAVLADASWGWVVGAAVAQLCAIATSVLRWDRLLVGQGIRAPKRHLVGSFMIGRFFGAFTLGGWTGLNGYRLYDIATQTGKTARSAAAIGIEMILGVLALSAVVVVGSIYGLELIGVSGLIIVDGFFIALMVVAITLISRPRLFVAIAARLPGGVRTRLQTTLDAIFAYEGQGGILAQATALGMGTHAFNNMIYVCTAHALGIDLSLGMVFFGASLQIFTTLLPVSINGIGLREATAAALYASVGIPAPIAALIATLGFTVEMFISSFGGLVFMARRVGYSVEVKVEDEEREQVVAKEIERVDEARWPKVGRGAAIGGGGGLLGGALLGLGEAAVTLASGSGQPDLHVLWYGALAYGLLFGGAGLVGATVLAFSGRLMQRAAMAEPLAYGLIASGLACAGALPIAAFRIRRDLYHEELVWKSAQGLGVLVGCLVATALTFLLLAWLLRALGSVAGGKLLRPWTTPALVAGMLVVLFGVAVQGTPAVASLGTAADGRKAAPSGAGNVLFIVVDTLRADYLPAYGHEGIETPHLDALAKDAIVYDKAFANASWTRPSFASILTGRYPSSHNTMSKSASLPDDIVTLPEAMAAGGYTTMGVATNYNVAPFFNFHQGFDRYAYLEPRFVLGANDTAAKLLFIQAAKRVIEKLEAKLGRVEEGSAYRDAQHVNASILGMLDEKPRAPWLMFAGYMDPHDPYYPHPYDGTGYSRAANQSPKPEEVDTLRGLYEGEIEYWDAHFGKLVAELKQRGLYDDLTIVVTSDHGEEFMEHGGYWHGTTLYDEQVHVPLLVKFPKGGPAGQHVGHWVQSIDLMPTLLATNALSVPGGVQGKQLSQDAVNVFAEESHEGNVLRALRTRSEGMPLKLIEANPGNPRGLDPEELYDMLADKAEQENMAQRGGVRLDEARKTLQRVADAAKRGAVDKQEVNLAGDASTLERLKNLGYATDDEPAVADAGIDG